jgi:hypothetical protein
MKLNYIKSYDETFIRSICFIHVSFYLYDRVITKIML